MGSARPANGREQRAYRVEVVVGDLAGPDEVPQRVAELRREPAACSGKELRKERRASRLQHLAKAIVDGAVRPCLGSGAQKREMLGKEQCDTPVLRANCAAAHPHDRTGAEQGVEVTRVVLLDASRQDPCLEI